MEKHIAIIWQRFLPYHRARVRHACKRFGDLGFRLTAIEVASQDASYGFPSDGADSGFERVCCFPESSYHDHKAKEIYEKVLQVLSDLKPTVVFAPATAFPEGMAALAYRQENGTRTIMMDDAWERSDRKGPHVRMAKRVIHKNVDGAFVPAVSHLSYYRKLGFTDKRVVFGVDVIDNEYFSSRAERARLNESTVRQARQLPRNYFLFVGRFLPRKGLETLLAAYEQYSMRAKGAVWELVLVGTGSHLDTVLRKSVNTQGIHCAGVQFGDDLTEYYGLAGAVIVPSDRDPWGLVVNEAMASGSPVLVSTGCGAAKTLVQEGENGWTFDPGDVAALSDHMLNIAELPPDALVQMGKRSQAIIAEWSLDRFVDGALKAIEIPRRQPAGLIADIATRLWKGRVNIT